MNTNLNTTRSIMNAQRTLSLILLTVLALMIAGCGTGGVEPKSSAASSEAPSTSEPKLAAAYPNTIRVWRDFSDSMDDDTLESVADDLVAGIARHTDRFAGIEVVRFSEANHSIWQAIPTRFIWGTPPVIKEFHLDDQKAPADVKMFKDARRDYQLEQQRLYNEDKERILKEYESRVNDQLSKFKAFLLERPTAQAPCTHFASLAVRIKKEDLPYNLTISDGWADCPDESNGAVSGVELHGKHVIIQVVRQADTQANDSEIPKREAFLHTLFPSSEIFQPASLGKAVDELLR